MPRCGGLTHLLNGAKVAHIDAILESVVMEFEEA